MIGWLIASLAILGVVLAAGVGGVWFLVHIASEPTKTIVAENKVELVPDPGMPERKEPKAPLLPQVPPPEHHQDPPPVAVQPAAMDQLGGNASLTAEVLARVKKATVFVRVIRWVAGQERLSSGTGFFAQERGLILTNAHVLGMLAADSKGPAAISVVINSGQANEKSYIGHLVSLDRDSDLAVLRLDSHDVDVRSLPEPLTVVSAENLLETQQVFVFGYPFGEQLGKDITVSSSSVTSLRRRPDGTLAQVQVNGGMHPGNSGGPVVNSRGQVVGVAVSVILGTQINFAIPGDAVRAVLNGRFVGLFVREAAWRDNNLVMPVKVSLIDPLNHFQEVAVDWWTGDLGPARPADNSIQFTGDTTRKRVKLARNGDQAVGELVLPTLPPGKVYWYQPLLVERTGNIQLQTVHMRQREPVLVAKPAVLTKKLRYTWWARTNVSMRAALKFGNDEGTEIPFSYLISGSYNEHSIGSNLPRGDVDGLLSMTGDGKLGENLIAIGPNNFLSSRLDQGLEFGKLFPEEKTYEPGAGWGETRSMYIGLPGIGNAGKSKPNETANLNLKYTYQGSITRQGREFGVITCSGSVEANKDAGRPNNRKVTGKALVDLEEGLVVQNHITAELFATLAPGKRVYGNVEVDLQRCSTTLASAKASGLEGWWHVLQYDSDGQAKMVIDSQLRCRVINNVMEFWRGTFFQVDSFLVDNNTTPMEIEVRSNTFRGFISRLGICAVEGDTALICIDSAGKGSRPREFASSPGKGLVLIVLKRDPVFALKEPTPPPTPPRSPPVKKIAPVIVLEPDVPAPKAANAKPPREPRVQTKGELARLKGHTDTVFSVAISPNGAQAVSAGMDFSVRLWDLATGKQVRRFDGHKGMVLAAAFSADGAKVLTSGRDRTLRLWDAKSGRELLNVDGQSGAIYAVCFSPNDRYAATGGDDKVVRLWDVATGKLLRTHEGHKWPIYSVRFSPNGRLLVSCSVDGVYLWDVATGKQIRQITGPSGESFRSVVFSSDGRRVLAAGSGQEVCLWETDSGKLVRSFKGYTKVLYSVAFSADDRYILAGGDDERIYIWDAASGKQLPPLEGHEARISTLAVSPGGGRLVSAGADCVLHVWQMP